MGLTVIIGIVLREIVKRGHNEGWSRNTVGLYIRSTELFQTLHGFTANIFLNIWLYFLDSYESFRKKIVVGFLLIIKHGVWGLMTVTMITTSV